MHAIAVRSSISIFKALRNSRPRNSPSGPGAPGAVIHLVNHPA